VKRRNFVIGAVGFATVGLTDAAAALAQLSTVGRANPRAILNIDPGAPKLTYSPMIFGGFLEHFGDQVYGGIFDPDSPLSDGKGFRRDVVAALRELRTPIVRWPGGCFVSGYRWEHGVAPQRLPTHDMAWGVIEPNTFGTNEYVELCRLLGWEPFICTNAGNGTIEEMRAWVEYCNATEGKYAQVRQANGYAEPLNVPIWSIGNENYHPTEIGHKPIEQWAPFVAAAAKEMKAADPSIKLTAAAVATREWTLPLLQAAGPDLDYISIHDYWLHLWHRNDMPDYLTCIMKSEGPERSITRVVGILDEAGYRGRIKIAYDEWNLRGWYHPNFPRTTVQDYSDPELVRLVKEREKNDIPSQYTMADALFNASFFNACLRHADDVAMANLAPIVNTRGPLFVHPDGIVRRTHFHTMAIYANELEAEVVQTSLEADTLVHGTDSVPAADAVATVDRSGRRWALALVNRHPSEPLTCTVNINDRPLNGTFAAVVLAGDSPEAFNSIENPERVTPVRKEITLARGVVELPPHSLTVLKVVQ
jgi:alpha-L-arabinofuranosidase